MLVESVRYCFFCSLFSLHVSLSPSPSCCPLTMSSNKRHSFNPFSRLERKHFTTITVYDDPRIGQVWEIIDAHKVPREAVSDENIATALQSKYSGGSVEKNAELLLYFYDAMTGTIVPVTTKANDSDEASEVYYSEIQGADNRNSVSCYLDSLIFSMFARLESFEPMLKSTDDQVSKPGDLVVFLRLYVNLLRSGKLITTDITQLLLTAIKKAGWHSNCAERQQDCCDLFEFISDYLEMPMITLKMDIAHEGKEDKKDDHRLINERLLLVSVPSTEDNSQPILLEECLENYFANSISVSRQIERRRTLENHENPLIRNRKFSVSIHTQEITGSNVPFDQVSSSDENPLPRIVVHDDVSDSKDTPPPYSAGNVSQPHSIEKRATPLWNKKMEINLPAWMFLQLVPFYTNRAASEQSGVPIPSAASRFANTRPVVGICLKRSEWSASNKSTLNNREVIVPQVIHFPSFVADDGEEDGDSKSVKYVLVLESAIFHRGTSTDSGHFISMARENCEIGYHNNKSHYHKHEDGDEEHSARWILFDDLLPAGEKVKEVNFDKVLHEEKPYILFYRLVTFDDYQNESLRHKSFNESHTSLLTVTSTSEESDAPVSSSTPFSKPYKLSPSFMRRVKSRPPSEPPSRSSSPIRHSLDETMRRFKFGDAEISSRRRVFKKKTSHMDNEYRDEKCVVQ